MKGKTTDEQECLFKTHDDLTVNGFDEDTENYSDKPFTSALPKHHETSILLAIRAAVPQEDNLHSFISHVLSLFRNSSNAVVCRTLLTVVAIFIFIVGVIRFRECPYEQELPLFLVLEGAVIIIKTGLHTINTCHRRSKDENERNTIDTCSDILSLFLVLWTITGSVWTFGVYSHVNIDEESRDCSKFPDTGFVTLANNSGILVLSSGLALMALASKPSPLTPGVWLFRYLPFLLYKSVFVYEFRIGSRFLAILNMEV